MKTYTDKQIIDGIRNKDNEVLTWVYKTNFSFLNTKSKSPPVFLYFRFYK